MVDSTSLTIGISACLTSTVAVLRKLKVLAGWYCRLQWDGTSFRSQLQNGWIHMPVGCAQYGRFHLLLSIAVLDVTVLGK